MNFQIEKQGKVHGLDYVIIAHPAGHRCGYVGVPKNHPLHGVEYSQNVDCLKTPDENERIGKRGCISLLFSTEKMQSPEIVFNVHGSLTYSGTLEKFDDVVKDHWWFGFDCSHLGDAKDLSIISNEYQKIEEMYDFKQPGDIIRDTEYVKTECESLAYQINQKVVMANKGIL